MRFENLAMFQTYVAREEEHMPFTTVDRDGVIIGKFSIADIATIRCDFKDDEPGVRLLITFDSMSDVLVAGVNHILKSEEVNITAKTVSVDFDSNLTASRALIRICNLIKALC